MASRSTPGSRQLSPIRAIIENGTGARTPQLDRTVSINEDPTEHPALNEGGVAVITGGAGGIGLAAAHHLAEMGLRIVLADIDEAALSKAGEELKAAVEKPEDVITVVTDVSKHEDVLRLKERALDAFGEVTVLLNNAGIDLSGTSWSGLDNWHKVIDTNFWGIVNVQQVFIQYMIHQENPSMIINTGSKQGITNPPGNAAYNASKAAVKSLTEQLAYELEQNQAHVSAHLFVPGWTYTGMTKGNHAEKPAGAWSAQQTVQYLFDRVRHGDFYIICPDNETNQQLDKLRMRWAAEDISENRPALSRWHPEWKARFDEYIKDGMDDHIRRRKSPFRKVVFTEGDEGVELGDGWTSAREKERFPVNGFQGTA